MAHNSDMPANPVREARDETPAETHGASVVAFARKAVSLPLRQAGPLPGPRAWRGRPQAKLGPIAVPSRADVAAYTKPEAFDRWNAGVRAAGEVGQNVITMYDVIGEDFWTGGGVTLKRVDAALRKIGDQPVEVQINSPGGDMFEGIGIYNRLLEHSQPVTVKVLGLAASAASIIAMAGSEILIGPASFFMIHNCWVLAVGNRHDMAETAAYLEPFDDAMAGVYADRTGQKKAEVASMMDAETWINGDKAKALGFADGVLKASDLAEDPATSEQARATNAVRQAEIALCRTGSSRAEARALLNKIKGMLGAAPEGRTPDAAANSDGKLGAAGDYGWLEQAAALTRQMRA